MTLSRHSFSARRRWLTGLVAMTAAVAGAGSLAAPAEAAAAGTAKVVGTDKVQFTAAKGKVNSLSVSGSGRSVTFDDAVAVKPGRGCKRVGRDTTKVRCTTSAAPKLITIALGNRSDSLTNRSGFGITVWGGSGKDRIIGGGKADHLHGGPGNDTIRGQGGPDQLFGDAGNDALNGGGGNDVLLGGAGADTHVAGGGNDTVSYADHTAPVTVDLDGRTHDDGARGERDTIDPVIFNVTGGRGNDTITGNGLFNTLRGGPGNDTVHGGPAMDYLYGDAGNDKVYGDAGDDYLIGEGWDWANYRGIGSNAALDRLDGGGNDTAFGDACYGMDAANLVRCEHI